MWNKNTSTIELQKIFEDVIEKISELEKEKEILQEELEEAKEQIYDLEEELYQQQK